MISILINTIMIKSKSYNIKLALFCLASSIVFGAYVPDSDASKVARSIYIERDELHDRDEFSISSVEIITLFSNSLFISSKSSINESRKPYLLHSVANDIEKSGSSVNAIILNSYFIF